MKGRILLAHVFFDILGGGEFLALNAARALKENGYDVTIFTYTPIDADKVKKMFNIDVDGLNIIVKRIPLLVDVLKKISRGRLVRLRRLMAYRKFFTEYMDEIGRDYDLVMETQSNVLSPADISYIHYPALIYFETEKGSGLHWRLYNWIVKFYAEKFKHLVPSRVLTNSSWTAAQIYKAYHIIPDVVHPPVNIEYFNKASNNDKREKIVVTISRFTEEKRLDKIVDVAAKLRDYTFVLIGSTYEYSYKVLDEIEKKVKEYRLDNVVVETNLPRTKMLGYLKDSRYYLHPEFAEHFGISVVESMAAGLVPLVYRDGGAWYDVVSRIDYRLGYNSIEEVPNIIRSLDSNQSLYQTLRERSIRISKLFNYESFSRNLLEKVEFVLRVKNIAC